MKTEQLKIEYRPLSEVEQWPRNPKQHDTAGIDQSIERWGYNDPMAIDERTGKLVEGHGRLAALRRLKEAGKDPPGRVKLRKDGEWLVPVLRGVSFANESEAEAYLLAHNRLVERGGWDDAMLAAILKDLGTAEVPAIGWDQAEIEEALSFAAAAGGEALAAEVHRRQAGDEGYDTYKNNEIKRIVLFLDDAEFRKVIGQLDRLMADLGANSHTEVVARLLDKAAPVAPEQSSENAPAT